MRMWERREEAIAYFFASLKRAGYLGGSAGGQMMLKELFCLSLSLSLSLVRGAGQREISPVLN